MRSFNFLKIPKNLKGKTVLVRVDFNEPLDKKGRLKDTFRIRETAPTLRMLYRRGARLILLAHLEGSTKKKQLSLKLIVPQLRKLLGIPLEFCMDYERDNVRARVQKKPVLMENIRLQKGEVENDPRFARFLASFADIYVNEAFSVSHRPHVSFIGLPRFLPSFAGPLFEREVEALSHVLKPRHPFLVIIGGANFKTKLALLNRFVRSADGIFLGGMVANTFLAAHGLAIGKSVYEKEAIHDIQKYFLKYKKFILPFDVIVDKSKKPVSVFHVPPSRQIQDIGPDTIALLCSIARDAKYVLWNGPLGVAEEGFTEGTRNLLIALAELPKTKVILGGGDTLEVLHNMKLSHKFYHVSTGGGAMLDFLANGSLPGIDALITAQKKMLK